MRDLRVPIIADDEQFQRRLKDNAGAARLFSREWSDAQIKVALAKDRLSAAEKKYGVESAQAARATLQLRGAQRELIGESGRLTSILSGQSREMRHARGELGSLTRGAVLGSGAFKEFRRNILFASSAFLGAAGFISVIKTSVDQADKLDHQLERTSTVFGSNAAAVKRWSKTSADGMGLSRAAALENASAIGTLLKNMAFVPAQAAEMSKALVQRASDVGASRRTAPGGVLTAFEAGLAGRTRGLKQYGIVIDAAMLKEEAYRLGIAKTGVDEQKVADARTRVAVATAKASDALAKYGPDTTQAVSAALTQKKAEEQLQKALDGKAGALTAAQKAAATYALILAQTTDAQGKFKGSSQDLEVQQLKLRAQISNLEADIGNQLRPEILAVVRDLDGWVKHLNETGDAHRLVKEAVHDLSVAVHAGADIVHAAADAFHKLSIVAGGDKQAIELLVLAFAGFKTASLLGSLAKVSSSLELIGVNAGEKGAAGKVALLASRLRGLSLMGAITIPIAIDVIEHIVKDYQTHHTKGHTAGPGGLPQEVFEQNGHYYKRVAVGRAVVTKEITKQEAEGLLGQPSSTKGPGDKRGAYAASVPAQQNYSQSELAQLWIQAGGDPAVAQKMAAIAMAESHGRSNATNYNKNGTTDRGVWQINSVHGYTAGQSYNPLQNAKQAVSVYNSQGITAWSTYNNGAYVRYMTGGGGGGGGTGTGLHVGTVPPKPRTISGAALLPISLRVQLSADAAHASTASGSAAAAWLHKEKADLEEARKLLEGQLKTATGKQKDAVRLEISNINTKLGEVAKKTAENLKAQAAAIKSSYTARVDAAKSTFTSAFNQLQSDLLSQLAANTQKYIDTVLGPKFFQNGLLTPLEGKLAGMQTADTAKGLKDSLAAARKQLGLDQNGSPLETILDVATGKKSQIFSGAGTDEQIQADKDAVDAAQRAIDENNLAIDAVAERTKADKDYAAAVTAAQDAEVIESRRLNDRLVELQNGVFNGTRRISELAGIAQDFGLTIAPGGLLQTDFTSLGGAAQALARILLEEAQKLAALGDTKDADAIQKIIDDLGGPKFGSTSEGVPFTPGSLGAQGYFLLNPAVPHLAKGGIVTQPTLALIGEAGREAIVPLDSGGIIGGDQVIDNHISIDLDGRTVWSGLKRHAVRDGRLNVRTGIK